MSCNGWGFSSFNERSCFFFFTKYATIQIKGFSLCAESAEGPPQRCIVRKPYPWSLGYMTTTLPLQYQGSPSYPKMLVESAFSLMNLRQHEFKLIQLQYYWYRIRNKLKKSIHFEQVVGWQCPLGKWGSHQVDKSIFFFLINFAFISGMLTK